MNCKPGDLAYIVDSTNDSNRGRVVEVIREWGDHPKYGRVWTIRCKSALETWAGTLKEAEAPDAWLRPISGAPVDQEQCDEVTA